MGKQPKHVANFYWGTIAYHADEPIPLRALEKGVDEVIESLTKSKARKPIPPGFRRFTTTEMKKRFRIAKRRVKDMARQLAEMGKIEGNYEIEKFGLKTYLLAKEIPESGHPGT